ncbi:MAG TPA: TetR/AcrR family transcriptional regulator [Vicinamibacterales bacterium]|nr:TetR/AcrR family transcriptional regulator [Vicinamibacterales bacterium]
MARTPRDTRTRILDAARLEFADRGFAGAGVDTIARRARVNKAMIYYHFADKQALYRETLSDLFSALTARVRAIDEALPPATRIERFIETAAGFLQQHPELPRIMLRELAEGGTHLDQETLTTMQGLALSGTAIIAQGVADGTFRPVHPVLTYFTVVGPLMMYLGGAPIRHELVRRKLFPAEGLDSESFVRHLQTFVKLGLTAGPDTRATTARRRPTRRTPGGPT